MTLTTCPSCSARNDGGGSCNLCGQSLGSPGKALVAAVVSTLLLGAGWVGASWATGLQLLPAAMVFGGLVSGAVAWYSRGRGLYYQLVASACTLIGMLAADTLVILLFWDRLVPELAGQVPLLKELVLHQALYDPATLAFMTLGLMGGTWLWRDDAGHPE